MQTLKPELALRIALAARVLPGVDVATLIDILHDRVGMPLDDEALKRVTVTNLKTGIGSLDGEEDGEDIAIGLENIKLAVRFLWGEESDEHLPQVQPCRPGKMPGSVRVAVASNSGDLLNGHFGSCLRYLIYQLSADDMRLIDIRSAVEADEAPDRNQFRVDLIRDCQLLFVQTMGGPAAARVIRADIYPIKVPEVVPAPAKLAEFQRVFQAPPPWFAKILGLSAQARKRFRAETQLIDEI